MNFYVLILNTVNMSKLPNLVMRFFHSAIATKRKKTSEKPVVSFD